MKTCRHCGAINKDDAFSCDSCGGALGIIPDVSAQPVKEQVQPHLQRPQILIQQVQPQQRETQTVPPAVQQTQQTEQQTEQPVQPDGSGTAAVGTNNKKQKLIFVITAIVLAAAALLLILFRFVFKSKDQKLIGSWKTEKSGIIATFNKDGTALIDGEKMKYSVDGDKLKLDKGGDTDSSSSGDLIWSDISIVQITDDTLELRVETSASLYSSYYSQTEYNEPSQRSIVENVTLKKVGSDQIIQDENRKGKLIQANANSKLAFAVIKSKAADIIDNGASLDMISTDGVVSVKSLEYSSDPILRAVYEAFSDGIEEANLGYIYIDFDPNIQRTIWDEDNYIQWSETKEGDVFGQFPMPIEITDKYAEFGTVYKRWMYDDDIKSIQIPVEDN